MKLPNAAAMQARLGLVSDGDIGPITLQAMAAYVCDGAAPAGVGKALAQWLPWAGINNRLAIIAFLANCAHESGFKPKAENLNYTTAKAMMKAWPSRFPTATSCQPYLRNPEALANRVYGGRMGNVNHGDGWRFRGRSAAQLTGREAYREVGDLLGLPLEDDPDLILTVPGGIAAAAGFWRWKKIGGALPSHYLVRKRWNGGENGLSDVLRKTEKLINIWP